MTHLDFLPCPADQDVCMTSSQKSYRSYYYEYVLIQTDDVLVICYDEDKILR